MRFNWREFSGFGELLCLVLAWMIGLGAMWAEYSDNGEPSRKVAVSSAERSSEAFFD